MCGEFEGWVIQVLMWVEPAALAEWHAALPKVRGFC